MNGFVDFLRSGKTLNSIMLGVSVHEVIEKLGEPVELMGDKMVGYVEYENGLRFGYFKNTVDEIAIIFHNTCASISIGDDSVVFDVRIENVTSHTLINEFILLLNDLSIKWSCFDEGNINVFCVRLESNICALFDLSTGKITKISTM